LRKYLIIKGADLIDINDINDINNHSNNFTKYKISRLPVLSKLDI